MLYTLYVRKCNTFPLLSIFAKHATIIVIQQDIYKGVIMKG